MSTTTSAPRSSIAALVGNGLSIAYDPALRIDTINEQITVRINRDMSAAGTPVARTLVRVARGIHSGDPETDFEALIGALEQYAVSLRTLQPLASITGRHDGSVGRALQDSSDFIDLLRNEGLSHVLEVIAEASRVDHNALGGIQQFVDDLAAAASGGRLTIGNLNYDSLLMATLATNHHADFCDMSDPRHVGAYRLSSDGPRLQGYELRTRSNYPDRPIRLVHLHGSLSWLRRRNDGRVVKFMIGDLRDSGYWTQLRSGSTDWEPQVVLTNQPLKSNAVLHEPYALAYQTLGEALTESDRWLVVGYSFRDACVNEMLRLRYEARAEAGIRPQVLVVTMGEAPSRSEVLNALGVLPWGPASWLTIYRGGVQTVAQSDAWSAWRPSAGVTARAA